MGRPWKCVVRRKTCGRLRLEKKKYNRLTDAAQVRIYFVVNRSCDTRTNCDDR